jgi:hypothetical protein
LNLDNALELLSKLPIKSRDSGIIVPFIPNPNQSTFYETLKKQFAQIGMLRAIVLKARRVGISSASDGLLVPHCLSRPGAHAKIVAHRSDTAEGLFRVPRDFTRALPFVVGEIMVKKIIFHHKQGNSLLDIATAGAVSGGRGLTLSALHLSEAAQFSGEDSFLSLLPAVQRGPGSMVFIESTAFGRVGVGRPFYEFWTNSVKGKTGYVPVFLSWLDDPGCVRHRDEAPDAPASDEERHLMDKPFCATREQIAWFRHTLESECQGLMPKMMQENPHTAEVAFVSSGDPAFTEEEIAYVRKKVCRPRLTGTLEFDGDNVRILEDKKGALAVWESPLPDHRYYIGADAATGVEDGDFAAYCILDGTTGHMVARCAERIHPEVLARNLLMAGTLYNKALINIELTGHLGRTVYQRLRDDFRYNNLYGWKGKDDKLNKPGGPGAPRLGGWETTAATRRIVIDQFRAALRGGIKSQPGGIEVYDEELLYQMDLCTLTERASGWEVERGHDDILFAYFLANIGRVHYPPPLMQGDRSRRGDIDGDDPVGRLPFKVQDDVTDSLKRHYAKLSRGWESGGRPEPLDGI